MATTSYRKSNRTTSCPDQLEILSERALTTNIRGVFFMKKPFMFISTMLLSSLLFACGGEKEGDSGATQSKQLEESEKEAQSSFQTFEDSLGNKVTVSKDVKTIVTLSPEMLILLSDLGIEVTGTTDNHMNLPVKKNIQKVGGVHDINMEKVIALSPDLVIGAPHFHAKLMSSMSQNNIPMALMKMTSFEDVKETARTYGKILRIEETVKEKIADAQKKVDDAIAKVGNISRNKVVVLNVTPGGISIQKDSTTALTITQLLGLQNIADNLPSLPKSVNSAPFSMEELVAAQPDYIFITIHGATEAGTAIIESDLKGDAAWKTLKAVKDNQIHVLPSELFLTNPGLRYYEAIQYMGEVISQ